MDHRWLHRRTGRLTTLVVAAAIGVVGLPATEAFAVGTATNRITYVYDELGRVEAAINPTAASNGVARYTYDDNGNILSVARSSHTAISIIDFHGNRGEVGDTVTIYGTAFNATLANNNVRFTKSTGQSGSLGQLATVLTASTTTLTVTVPSGLGDGPIWVKNTGTNQAILSVEVFDFLGAAGSQTPTITNFTPVSGDIGTTVTINGTRFNDDEALNVVTFNNSRAVVTDATTTQLTVSVPPGASTGQVDVRTPQGSASSSPDFLMPLDKKAGVVPISEVGSRLWRSSVGGSQAVTIPGGLAGVIVFPAGQDRNVSLNFSALSNPSPTHYVEVQLLDPYDLWVLSDLTGGNETLATVTLPYDGDYAILLRPNVTQTFTVTIQNQGVGLASAETLQPADESWNLPPPEALADEAIATPSVWEPKPLQQPWTTGSDSTPFEWLRLNEAPKGITALSGQILSLQGYPVRAVTVELDGVQATTDQFGRFLLKGLTAGAGTLFVDGRSANSKDIEFASFEIGVDVADGETTELDYVIWMPRLDPAVRVPIQHRVTKEIVLRHPSMPGLEVHIPAGSRVTGPGGEPVKDLTLMPLPLDRPPFPVEPGVGSPVYWTLQPGPITIHGKGAWVTYPNPVGHPPGARVDLWYYEPDEGWEVFGEGVVNRSGEQVVGKTVRIHYFDGVMDWGGFERQDKERIATRRA